MLERYLIGLGTALHESGRREGIYFLRAWISILRILGAKSAAEGAEALVGNHLEVGRVPLRG